LSPQPSEIGANTVFTFIKYRIHPIYSPPKFGENVQWIVTCQILDKPGFVNEVRGNCKPQAIWPAELLFVIGFSGSIGGKK